VSEALYLQDPDHNGVELYWDRPEALWPRHADGTVNMRTDPLTCRICSPRRKPHNGAFG